MGIWVEIHEFILLTLNIIICILSVYNKCIHSSSKVLNKNKRINIYFLFDLIDF